MDRLACLSSPVTAPISAIRIAGGVLAIGGSIALQTFSDADGTLAGTGTMVSAAT